ncbi:DNA primase [Blochmannia endosymbiont of Polyrhachis (Hedomyrma) turneri]|uniref:DNA primase n=1 Tax=Blochmannia endosymbiont of Polyrhachis (Hedomyrma) turneri TaxID=1505596 RepID=UPI00061A6DBC|nr:DNA primase [Blochmannia endosymbiont of Polyrhachis (Hedomyrma) turneri]AKC59647.1 DNA primase [Blochmannia endosymbiont of Polyrhachis (Hedomyrma) turneri]
MTHLIPSSIIHDILSRTNIVDLINTRIKLKKTGKNFYGYCPFHQEKHPSFSVSFEKQFYYCFSCGVHGNAIDFLIHYEHIGFVESIKELASIHGINITPYNSKFNSAQYQEQQELYNLMNNLNIFYQNNLTQNSAIQAREYLQTRGLNPTIIKYFNIGFAKNEWKNVAKEIGTSKKTQRLLNKAGILIINNQGHMYDRFRERIIFPIRNKNGQVIAFGGRAIGNKTPKYLNSPDTDIFKKRKQLYGLYELKKTNQSPPYILLVEGYMDVITLTQFGIHHAVASLGTSTSVTHIQLLYHNTEKIICCYDGDQSGQKAAWRTLKTTLPYLTDNRILSFVFLPKTEDPDTLIRKIGKTNFLKYIQNAEPLSIFLFKTLLKKVDIKTIEGRSKFGHLALSIINVIPGKILRMQLHQELGNKIGILDDNKLKQLSAYNTTNNHKTKHQTPKIKNTTINILIKLLLQKPQLATLISINKNDLINIKEAYTHTLIELIEFCKNYPQTTLGYILEHYRRTIMYRTIKQFITWNYAPKNDIIQTIFKDTLLNLKKLILIEQQETLIAMSRNNKLTKEQSERLWHINKILAKNK